MSRNETFTGVLSKGRYRQNIVIVISFGCYKIMFAVLHFFIVEFGNWPFAAIIGYD